ncbi:hypothetical protein DDO72_07280 [Vibrio cholerae]|nr:hypothetical protein [Vibrio cholerae]
MADNKLNINEKIIIDTHGMSFSISFYYHYSIYNEDHENDRVRVTCESNKKGIENICFFISKELTEVMEKDECIHLIKRKLCSFLDRNGS